MQIELALYIQSTGEEIARGVTDKSAKHWEGIECRRLLRDSRVKQTTKEAIEREDVITGWSNFDECVKQGASIVELENTTDFLFNTYYER